MHASDRPLAEDELVGLLERTALARNRALVRRLALAVLTYDGTMARSEWARKLYLRVTFTTGARLLDGLSDEEFDTIIREARGAEWRLSGMSIRRLVNSFHPHPHNASSRSALILTGHVRRD
jgi:hypothetical protein